MDFNAIATGGWFPSTQTATALRELDPADDVDAFLLALGVTVIYTNGAAVATEIRGVWDNEYAADLGAGVSGVSTSTPAVTCKTSDVTSAVRGETITHPDETIYYIVENRPDGYGMTVLVLSRDAT